jgi:protoheme ferro-lyase
MRILIGIVIVLLVLASAGYGLFKYKNRPLKPDYFEYYRTQDTKPVGKVGIFVTGLIMPEKNDHTFFYNVVHKIFKVIIPWPANKFAMADKGVSLLDPEHVHMRKEFVPKHLEDCFGNDRDYDGTPYIEKYKQGLVYWKPPSKQLYLDHGYFIYKGRLGGQPSVCGKVANKARILYYDRVNVQKKLPHWQESFKIINATFDRLKRNYPGIECRAESNMYFYEMRQKLHDLLDAGCETIVLSSLMPVYSNFEDFNSGFRHCFEYIEEWEHSHPGKKIKVIIAPQIGDFQPLRQAYLDMLKDRLDTLPKGVSVTVAVTVHGMPWDYFKHEAWLKLGPPYRNKVVEEVQQMLATTYKDKFSRTNVVTCQDEFADPIWDPKKKYLSTNRAYWAAINDGYDYAISIPIEFLAENSDTMFHHAMKCYENFKQFSLEDPVNYPDWSVPYTRTLVEGKTSVIYNGLPVGKYQHNVIEAFYQSIDAVMSKKQGR